MKKVLASTVLMLHITILRQEESFLWRLSGDCPSFVVLLHCQLDAPIGQSAEHVNDHLWRCAVEATFPLRRAELLITESSRTTDTITMVGMNSIADTITMVGMNINIPHESSTRCCQLQEPQMY